MKSSRLLLFVLAIMICSPLQYSGADDRAGSFSHPVGKRSCRYDSSTDASSCTGTVRVSTASADGSPVEMTVSLAGSSEPVSYSHLLLIYPHTNATYLENGVSYQYTGSMSESHKQTLINAFSNLPSLISDGSNGVVSSTCDIIEIPIPVSKISSIGTDYYWIAPEDIQDNLTAYAPKGKYDSVHIIWNNGPIDAYFGLGGIFINDGTTTFSSLIAGQEWWWTDIGEAPGEPLLHEWLHGVCRFYEGLGYTMPERDADGAELHGYSKSETEGWMDYYRDLMTGHVWEPNLSMFTGITREAWMAGTPNNLSKSYPGDLDHDGDVDTADFSIFHQNYGATDCGNPADLDGDCVVGASDFSIFHYYYGSGV